MEMLSNNLCVRSTVCEMIEAATMQGPFEEGALGKTSSQEVLHGLHAATFLPLNETVRGISQITTWSITQYGTANLRRTN
jgi:hypothetical protein